MDDPVGQAGEVSLTGVSAAWKIRKAQVKEREEEQLSF